MNIVVGGGSSGVCDYYLLALETDLAWRHWDDCSQLWGSRLAASWQCWCQWWFVRNDASDGPAKLMVRRADLARATPNAAIACEVTINGALLIGMQLIVWTTVNYLCAGAGMAASGVGVERKKEMLTQNSSTLCGL